MSIHMSHAEALELWLALQMHWAQLCVIAKDDGSGIVRAEWAEIDAALARVADAAEDLRTVLDGLE